MSDNSPLLKATTAFVLSSLTVGMLACSAFPQLPNRLVRVDKLTYHNDPQRSGWNARETILTPLAVAGSGFGRLWRTSQFDSFAGLPPRLFASPLYVDKVKTGAGRHGGRVFSVVYAVTTTGYVYAVNAFGTAGTPPGAILWRARLTERPCGKGAMGNLSTPVIDLRQQRLYVTSCDDEAQWRAHALDIRNGERIAGWPVSIDRIALNTPGINRNGATQLSEKLMHTQRGALNLSPDGTRLYVTFGLDFSSGWIVGIDTRLARVATAFSATSSTEEYQGGMWASGGPSVDAEGNVHIATGASSVLTESGSGINGVFPDSEHSWGQSILQLADDPVSGFRLKGVYTPFNYCQAAAADIDLGSSGTVVIDLHASASRTPHLLVGGGKQGNVYLLDRRRMPGGLEKRPPCSTDSRTDGSLLAPENQPHFGQSGPINVFGPYSDTNGMNDHAKSRTTAAYFRSAQGSHYVFVTGTTKERDGSTRSVPPGLVRLQIVIERGRSAYLRIDQRELTQTFLNPGSPIVTSHGGQDAIVWVLDTAPRTTPLYGDAAPHPVLYAFDALSLKLLWKSAPAKLATTGKYNEPTVAHGTVFVGTDRIEAFGLRNGSLEAATQAQEDEGFTSLFDGKTLNGWRGDPTLWSVEDGAITGKSAAPIEKNAFLIREGSFSNFEVRLKYRFLSEKGNSGLQYRSRPHPDGGEYSVEGYQANIVTPDANERFGFLYDENARGVLANLGEHVEITRGSGNEVARKVISALKGSADLSRVVRPYPEWNDYVVIAYQNNLIHAVNGFLLTRVSDHDTSDRAMEGFFALQLHAGPPMGVQIKDMEVKPVSVMPNWFERFSSLPTVEGTPQVLSPSVSPAAEPIYLRRCVMCHGSGQPDVPTREALAMLPRSRIVQALTNGAMQAQALGLSDAEINALAAFLTAPRGR